eukprot:scaffold15883_cov118-Isochrysis_galbana.AAC.1
MTPDDREPDAPDMFHPESHTHQFTATPRRACVPTRHSPTLRQASPVSSAPARTPTSGLVIGNWATRSSL